VLAFHNNDLGVGYEPEGARLSLELLEACSEDYEMPDRASFTAMGVDVGYALNVWIMDINGDRNRSLYIGEVLSWEDLDRLMVRYGVMCCVVDDGPELTADVMFAKRWPGKVFLANYQEDIKGARWLIWNVKEQKVQIDRTAGLDRSHGTVETMIDMWPTTYSMIPGFVDQMRVNIKAKAIDSDGRVRYHFPRTGKADHYDHAHVYALAAMERLRRLQTRREGLTSSGEAPATGRRRYRGRV